MGTRLGFGHFRLSSSLGRRTRRGSSSSSLDGLNPTLGLLRSRLCIRSGDAGGRGKRAGRTLLRKGFASVHSLLLNRHTLLNHPIATDRGRTSSCLSDLSLPLLHRRLWRSHRRNRGRRTRRSLDFFQTFLSGGRRSGERRTSCVRGGSGGRRRWSVENDC